HQWDRLAAGGNRIRTIGPASSISHSEVPHRFPNASGGDWPRQRETSSWRVGCTSYTDQDNRAIRMASCRGKRISMRCFHTEDRVVACSRCSCDRFGAAHLVLSQTLGVQNASGSILLREA